MALFAPPRKRLLVAGGAFEPLAKRLPAPTVLVPPSPETALWHLAVGSCSDTASCQTALVRAILDDDAATIRALCEFRRPYLGSTEAIPSDVVAAALSPALAARLPPRDAVVSGTMLAATLLRPAALAALWRGCDPPSVPVDMLVDAIVSHAAAPPAARSGEWLVRSEDLELATLRALPPLAPASPVDALRLPIFNPVLAAPSLRVVEWLLGAGYDPNVAYGRDYGAPLSPYQYAVDVPPASNPRRARTVQFLLREYGAPRQWIDDRTFPDAWQFLYQCSPPACDAARMGQEIVGAIRSQWPDVDVRPLVRYRDYRVTLEITVSGPARDVRLLADSLRRLPWPLLAEHPHARPAAIA